MGLLDDFQNSTEQNEEKKVIYSDNAINDSENNADNSISFKIMLLIIAIISGNIGSGYTTFWGINKLIDSIGIAILMTITIQGVMTATALIATSKKIRYKKSFTLLYVIPMIVSIGFNYIFFYSKFEDLSTKNSLEYNNIVQIEKESNKLQNYLSLLAENVEKGYEYKKENLLLKIANYEKIKKQELTRYGTGGAGSGPEYLNAEKEEKYYRGLLISLEKVKSEVTKKEEEVYDNLVEVNTSKQLKESYNKLLKYKVISSNMLINNIPIPPIILEKEQLKKGEGNIVYNSILALENPGLFEIISIVFGILMDFIIFIWVVISMKNNITFKDFVDEK